MNGYLMGGKFENFIVTFGMINAPESDLLDALTWSYKI